MPRGSNRGNRRTVSRTGSLDLIAALSREVGTTVLGCDGQTFPFLSNDRGEEMLPALTSDATFMTWEREQPGRFGRGRLLAADVFDTALA